MATILTAMERGQHRAQGASNRCRTRFSKSCAIHAAAMRLETPISNHPASARLSANKAQDTRGCCDCPMFAGDHIDCDSGHCWRPGPRSITSRARSPRDDASSGQQARKQYQNERRQRRDRSHYIESAAQGYGGAVVGGVQIDKERRYLESKSPDFWRAGTQRQGQMAASRFPNFKGDS